MDPHLLRTFTAVARLGSFSAAARELGYTQSAVSQHIAALEADLGVELLGRRPVAPTEAGARLLDHTGPLLARLAAARADVARVARTPGSRLAVGATALAFGAAAARALAEVRAELPRAEPSVLLSDAAGVVGGVAAGDVDLGLVSGAVAPTDPLHLPEAEGLVREAVGEEPLAVLLPPGHPLAGRSGLDLSDLGDALWLDAPAAAVPLAELRAAVPGACPAALQYTGADTRVVHELVHAAHGLAVLPRSAAGPAAAPLTAPRLVHHVEAVLRPGPHKEIALLLAALRRGAAR
ncbi:LysR family transcriptional regulator [Actinacidiphila acidipaludis]|uniref:LysR family transcriptional regulator n=1 Tax=Actinacidiphila acidipaludis TaxID=2873382 RepID=A0ABS7Q598_9ACTN|nr:LysR family transcriptional regulator [Streptomyces acidipaludis]MBY8878331.1 LysR family transcriptional regulator [Streptomyces acidipaludis]